MSTLAEQAADASSLEHILSSMDVAPEIFLQPSASLQAASLIAAKRMLDPVIPDYSVFRELALKGLDVEQVWEQIRLVGEQVKNALERQGEAGIVKLPATNGTDLIGSDQESPLDEDSDVEEADSEEENEEDVGEWDGQVQEEEEDSEDESESTDSDEFPPNPELAEESEEDVSVATATESKPFKKDVHGLNDEFFSIDDFNRLTERQDVSRSDEESADEIDYFAG
jgi:U3 small nucleolar RNA-associated protein MPP10